MRLPDPWFFYVAECADSSLYAGITTNIERRIGEHNKGARGARYTRSRRPVHLVMSREFPDRSSASKYECKFKKFTRKRKLTEIRRRNG